MNAEAVTEKMFCLFGKLVGNLLNGSNERGDERG
jgi:hypothetical protein